MAMPGMTFSPGSERTQSASPVQDAIRLLSFRMPSVVGQGAPSPPGVLAGTPPPPGGGGMPGQGMGAPGGSAPLNPILEQFLKLLMSGGMGAQGAGGSPMGWSPAPTVGYTPPVEHAPGPSPLPTPPNQSGPVASAPGPMDTGSNTNPWGDWMRQERNLGGGPQRFGG